MRRKPLPLIYNTFYENMSISTIIPIYNASRYLGRCLDSLIRASTSQIKNDIILVDDGSTDSSLEIAQSYSSKYHFIKIISQENHGASSARNNGLSVAKGSYISFVDSDDTVEPDYYQRLIPLINQGVDVIQFGYNRIEGDHNASNPVDFSELDRAGILNKILNSATNRFLWFTVRRIYKRTYMIENNIWFDNELRFNTDTTFSLKVMKNLTKLIAVNKNLYNYHKNDTSLTQMKYKKDRLKMFELQYQIRKNIKIKDAEQQLLHEDIADYYIDHALPYLFENIKNSPGSRDVELKNARTSNLYQETFENYRYKWIKHPRRSFLIKLFELEQYQLLQTFLK